MVHFIASVSQEIIFPSLKARVKKNLVILLVAALWIVGSILIGVLNAHFNH